MADDHAPQGENEPPDLEVEATDVEAIEDDSARHYLHDANRLGENARDEDEQEQDDVLDVDQTELDELGLTLDDPHQPESDS